MSKQILFINASEHEEGNTHKIGQRFLAGKDYQEVALVDYKIYQLGQDYPDDQLADVYSQIKAADQVVLGTPVYWHTFSGYLKVLMERISQMPEKDVKALSGTPIYLLVQGADPSDTIGPATKLVKRFCDVLGLEFVGSAATAQEIKDLQQQL